jgi:hypothetical protein
MQPMDRLDRIAINFLLTHATNIRKSAHNERPIRDTAQLRPSHSIS